MSWEIPGAMEAGGTPPIVTPTTPVTLGPLDDAVKTKTEIAAEEAKKRKDKGA